MKTRTLDKIRNRRTQLGLSQEELAERAGVSQTFVSNLEAGERDPSFTNLLKVCRVLRLPVSRLEQMETGRG